MPNAADEDPAMYARLVAVGRHVRDLREARGVSQTTLAEWAGLERKAIQRIETAAFVPSLVRVMRIADALGVPASRLLDGDPGPPPGTGRAPGVTVRPAKTRTRADRPDTTAGDDHGHDHPVAAGT